MTVIDDYLKDVNEPERQALERIRRIVRQTVPDAEEVITYGMPGFKYRGKYLLAFAVFKDHLSLFPGGTVHSLATKLGDFKLSKGTVQFTVEHPLPEAIVKEFLTLRIEAISKK